MTIEKSYECMHVQICIRVLAYMHTATPTPVMCMYKLDAAQYVQGPIQAAFSGVFSPVNTFGAAFELQSAGGWKFLDRCYCVLGTPAEFSRIYQCAMKTRKTIRHNRLTEQAARISFTPSGYFGRWDLVNMMFASVWPGLGELYA